jgi:hypothetical protein
MEFKSLNKEVAVQQLMNKGWDKDKSTLYVNKAHLQLKGLSKPSVDVYVETAIELEQIDQSQTMTSSMIDAVKALVKLGNHSEKTAISLVKNAISKLGSDADSSSITSFVISGGKTLPSEKPPTTATVTTPEQPSEPSEPSSELPTPPKGLTQEQQLKKVNKGLKSIGVDTLDNVKQLAKLFSLKGSWNSKIKTMAKNQDKQELLDNVLGRGFDVKHDKIWTKLVASVKASSPTTEGLISKRFINPFVPENFVH